MVILIFFLVFFIIFHKNKKKFKLNFQYSLIAFCYVIYPYLINDIVTMISCKKIGEGYYLKTDFNITCYDNNIYN